MQESLYQSDTNQGEITSKGLPDHDEFAARKHNAATPAIAMRSYPGGENPMNLHMMAHELAVCRRDGNAYDMGSAPNQRVFSSLSGFHWGAYGSLEAAMRNHIVAGILKTGYKVDSYDQTEGGVTFYVAGSGSIINNGEGDIFAGDWVEWYFPDTYESRRQRPDGNRPAGIDSGIVYQNHAGEPNTKVLVQVRRFDPRNFDTCLAGVWNVIGRESKRNKMPDDGIGGLTYEDLQHTRGANDSVNLETLQEEALGFQNSLIMMALLLGNHLVANRVAFGITDDDFVGRKANIRKVCEKLGLWNASGQGDNNGDKRMRRTTLLGILFRPYLVGNEREDADGHLIAALEDDRGEPTLEAIKNNVKGHYASGSVGMTHRLAADPLGIFMGAVTSAQQARRSRILGKALGSAGQSDTLHLLLGHFRSL